jgi:hypothetical protein
VSRRFSIAATFMSLAAVGAASTTAHAYDAEVESSTTAQAYQLRGLTGDPVLSRRRVTQTLGLGVYNLVGSDKEQGKEQLFFRVRMRLDADFGMAREEYALNGGNPDAARFIPGLQPAPVDVMYGYLEGKRFLRGMLGFRVGRQYVVDPLGYYSFDGGLVRFTTPAFVTLEAYAGFEQRAGLPLSTGRWELGGVQRGDRTNYPLTSYPSFQKAGLAPLYSVSLESAGPTWIHGRLTYRKVWNTGSSFVAGSGALLGPDAMATYDARRVSSERLGYGLNAEIWDIAALRGALIYDLYGKQWNSIEAGVDVFAHERVTVGADYSYFKPIFDADSIFNVFGIEPMDDVSLRIEVDPTDRLSLEGDAMVRRYRADDPTNLSRVANSYAPGGGLRARYKWTTSRATIRGQALSGDQGNRIGSDLNYERTFADRWLFDVRLSLWHFEDKLRTTNTASSRTATSVGYVLGAGYKLSPEANAFLQFEHDSNRLVGQRLRIMAVLNVRTWL